MAWKRQPFGDEAVERRQRRNGDAADEKREGRSGHVVNEAAKMLHVAFTGRGQHRARAEEQQALEEGMVEGVQQAGRQGQRGNRGHAERAERQREPKPNENDADVLDRVVGEQSLEVVLHQSVENAEQGGARPDHQNRNAPPPIPGSRQFKDDPDEAIDGDFRHHPAHERGDMARRRGVGERQPHVQRHDPSFRAGADQRQQEREAGHAGRRAGRAHRVKGVAAGGAREQGEGQQQRERAETRHHDIDVAGARVVVLAMVGHHQRPRGDRHELPRQEKAVGVVGDEHEIHAGKECRKERQHALGRALRSSFAKAVEASRGAAKIDDDKKERRERVDAEMGADPRQTEGQRRSPRPSSLRAD